MQLDSSLWPYNLYSLYRMDISEEGGSMPHSVGGKNMSRDTTGGLGPHPVDAPPPSAPPSLTVTT